MGLINVKPEYLRVIHYLYFFVSVFSLILSLFSFKIFLIALILFVSSFWNLFIYWMIEMALGSYYKRKSEDDSASYVIIIAAALFFAYVPSYLGFISFFTLQLIGIGVSYFFLFWGLGNYIFTRIAVTREMFNIVNLTKFHFSISKIVDIFRNPEYENLMDVLNLIEPRLLKYYEPGSCTEVDELLVAIADEKDVSKLRKMIVALGIAIYDYELEVLTSAQGSEGFPDNSVLIRRFGYKKRLLELAMV